MLNSRDISALRPDVAENARQLMKLADAAGISVLVTGTVRDEAYQIQCFSKGLSKSKVPTFHSVRAGLAFDICQNIKGKEYDDAAFWTTVSAIGKKLGFTWGGDWTSIVDMPHFQWDDGGDYTGAMILSGSYPPPMKPYEEDEKMTQEEFLKLYDNVNPMIQDIDDVKLPPYLKQEVQRLLDSGVINGGTEQSMSARDINMRLETIKAIVAARR